MFSPAAASCSCSSTITSANGRPLQDKVVLLCHQQDSPTADFRLLSEKLQQQRPQTEVALLCHPCRSCLPPLRQLLTELRHLAVSRAVVIDTLDPFFGTLHHRRELRVIRMGRAMGQLYRFGFALTEKEGGPTPQQAELCQRGGTKDLLLVSSHLFDEDVLQGTRCQPEQIVELPPPRADLLTSPAWRIAAAQELYEREPLLRRRRNVLFCPVRHSEKILRRLTEGLDAACNLIYLPLEADGLTAAGEPPAAAGETADSALGRTSDASEPVDTACGENSDERPNAEESAAAEHSQDSPTIQVLRPCTDPFPLLCVADYLITDVSPLLYDAGLARIPVLLCLPDDESGSDQPPLTLDPRRDLPCFSSDDPQEICTAVNADIDGSDPLSTEIWDDYIADSIRLPRDSSCCAELLRLLEPSGEPETSGQPEPSGEPETSGQPEPSGEPETSGQPEPSGEPETSGQPEPSDEPQADERPEPSGEPQADEQR
ncbi:MAG: CDP-glycerol glycerophosphotransferase family protein [Anaerovoracaceae bacterium]